MDTRLVARQLTPDTIRTHPNETTPPPRPPTTPTLTQPPSLRLQITSDPNRRTLFPIVRVRRHPAWGWGLGGLGGGGVHAPRFCCSLTTVAGQQQTTQTHCPPPSPPAAATAAATSTTSTTLPQRPLNPIFVLFTSPNSIKKRNWQLDHCYDPVTMI